MLKDRRKIKITRIRKNKNKNSFLKLLKENFFKILLLMIVCLMIISIVGKFLDEDVSDDITHYNQTKLKDHNLEEIYMQKNSDHAKVRIWILNNTTQDHMYRNGLAAKIRECLEKGYKKNEEKVKGDYTVYNQDNLISSDRKKIGKKGIYFYSEETEIIVHNESPEFKPYIQELLSFTGFGDDRIKYNADTTLYKERDITIILGNDWENSNLEYCKEITN